MKKLITAAVLAFLSFNAAALNYEIKPLKNGFTGIVLSGEFEKGDTEGLRNLLNKQKIQKPIILFNSPGGDLYEGMRMGYFLHHNDITVTVNRCESACALAYLAAPSKFFDKDSRLGVHRFYTATNGQTKNTAQRQAQLEQEAQEVTSEVYKFAQKTGIDFRAIEIMFKTPSTSMYYFNRKQMEALGATFLD